MILNIKIFLNNNKLVLCVLNKHKNTFLNSLYYLYGLFIAVSFNPEWGLMCVTPYKRSAMRGKRYILNYQPRSGLYNSYFFDPFR